MEFSFNINEILRDEITEFDRQLLPCKRKEILNRYGFKQIKNMLFEIVNSMGEASSKAQGLSGAITTGGRLDTAGQRLYIMKDQNGNNGKGSVVGILKVGTKRLFVYDNSKRQHELEPLCVLDFYVHESRQRAGCGKSLFNHMLQREDVPVQHLAIDRPSHKFTSFLKKHYNMRAEIPQVNNFCIFEGFFTNRSDPSNRGRRNMYNEKPPTPVRPFSGQRSTRFNAENQSRNTYNSMNPRANIPNGGSMSGNDNHSLPNSLLNDSLPSTRQSQNGSMGAADMMYSRHGPSPSSAGSSAHSARRGPLQTQPSQPMQEKLREGSAASSYKQMNSGSSPFMYYSQGMNAARAYHGQGQTMNLPPRPTSNTTKSTGKPAESSATRRIPSGNSSMHGISNANTTNGPDSRPQSKQGSTPTLPVISNKRPPSGSKSKQQGFNQPPILQREGPPENYKNLLNMHQNFQGARGHLKVNDTTPTPSLQQLSNPAKVGGPSHNDESWTVGGYMRSNRFGGGGSRHYTTTRLW